MAKTWRDKAQEIVGALCSESYRQANTTRDGKRRKRHVAYSVPDLAADIIGCLDRDDEHGAKALFHRFYLTAR